MISLYEKIGQAGWLYDAGLHLTGYVKSVEYLVQALRRETGDNLTSILDVGCGTGQYSRALLQQFPRARVTAFDQEESLVKRARVNLEKAEVGNRVRLFTADATGPLSELQEKFDAIVVAGVLEYTPLRETVANVARFLQPGGYFLHVPVRDTVYGKLVGKLYRFQPYSRQELLAAFTSQGFQLRKIVTLSPFSLPSFKEAHIFSR